MTRGCVCARTARAWADDGLCTTCGQRVLESQLTPVLLQVLCGGTGLTLWRNNRGFDATRRIRYGVGTGGADYIGMWSPSGRLVAVEFKTATGRQSTEQRDFAALVERMGGVYGLIRNETDAQRLLARLRGVHA